MRSPCARQCDRLVSSSLIGARDIRVKVVGHFVDMRLPNTELPKLIEASYELVITERRVELGLALPLGMCGQRPPIKALVHARAHQTGMLGSGAVGGSPRGLIGYARRGTRGLAGPRRALEIERCGTVLTKELRLSGQRTKTTSQTANTAARQAKRRTVGLPELFGAKGCPHQAASVVIGGTEQHVTNFVSEHASECTR
jgi:hypothetical protein